MENEVKIDNKYLALMAKNAIEMAGVIVSQAEQMIDEKEDSFVRYLAHSRIRSIISLVNKGLEISQASFVSGNNMSHPLLLTDKAKECDWDKQKLHEDPFFTTERQEDVSTLSESILDAIKQAIGKNSKKKSSEH